MKIHTNQKEEMNKNGCSSPPRHARAEPLQMDSLILILLIAFLENEFGYRIEDEELIGEDFATLLQLGELLATKTPTGPTAEAKAPAQEGIPTFSAKHETERSSPAS